MSREKPAFAAKGIPTLKDAEPLSLRMAYRRSSFGILGASSGGSVHYFLPISDSPAFGMNAAQFKLTLIFMVFAVIGFGPISPGCLIGMSIVLMRPLWFHQLIESLYKGKALEGTWRPGKHIRVQSFLVLASLFVIDILPFPVTPSIVLPLIFIRPAWVYKAVDAIYRSPLH